MAPNWNTPPATNLLLIATRVLRRDLRSRALPRFASFSPGRSAAPSRRNSPFGPGTTGAKTPTESGGPQGCELNANVATLRRLPKRALNRVPSLLASIRRHTNSLFGGLDQLLSSATNFVAAVIAARSLSADDNGVYAVAFSVYLIALGVSRALASGPLVILASPLPPPDQARAARDALATSLVFGLSGVPLAFAASIAFGGQLGDAILALSLLLPVLLAQDTCRYALVMRGRSGFAALTDAAWLAAVLLLMPALLSKSPTAATATAAWSVGALPGLLIGLAVLDKSTWRLPLVWAKQSRSLAVPLILDFLLIAVTPYLFTIGVAALGGFAEVAGFRSAQVLVGPLSILFMAVHLQGLPHFSRLAASTPGIVCRRANQLSGVLTLATILCGAMLLVLPQRLGYALFGDTWPLARPLLPAFLLSTLAIAAGTGSRIAISAFRQPYVAVRARLVAVVLLIGLGLIGALTDGVDGAAWGLAAGGLASLPIWVRAQYVARSRANFDHRAPSPDSAAAAFEQWVDSLGFSPASAPLDFERNAHSTEPQHD
jgi:O-antigen/teichoic acid export membrane protein